MTIEDSQDGLGEIEDSKVSPEEIDEVRQLRATVLEVGLIAEEQRVEIARLRELAFKDPLLGIYNRRGLEERLGQIEVEDEREGDERRGSKRKGKCSIIFIDVDDFKYINDTYSHEVGDEVLCALALIIVKEARTEDTLVRSPEPIAGRMGGDEIAIVLPGADEEGARLVLERISRKVGELEIETEKGPVKFTISGGVGKNMREADEGMYGAKREKHKTGDK